MRYYLRYFLRYLPVVFFLNCSIAHAQQEQKLDSLQRSLEKVEGSAKFEILLEIYKIHIRTDQEEARRVLKEAEDLANSLNSDEGRAFTMVMRGVGYQLTSQFDSLDYISKKGIEFSRKIGYKYTLARFLNMQGIYYEKGGQLDSAIYFYLEVDELDVMPKKFLYNNLGLAYYRKRELQEAVKYLSLTIEAAQKDNDLTVEAIVANNLGNLYKEIGDLERARKYYFKSIESKGELGDERGKLFAYAGLLTLSDLEEKDRTEYGNEALAIATTIKDDYFIRYFTTSKANQLITQNKCQEAINLLQPLYQQDNAIGNFDNVSAEIYIVLLKANQCSGQLLKAKQIAEGLLEEVEKTNRLDQIQVARSHLLNIYLDLNDQEAYFKLAPTYFDAKDSIQAASNIEQLAEMESRLSDVEKEKEIGLLNATLKERAIRRNWIIIISILTALILSLIIYFRSRQLTAQRRLVEEEQKTARELAKVNEELTALDQMKTRFFTNISHELRTPVTLISTPISYILKQYGASFRQEVKKSLELAKKNARQLQNLVEELLELSRIDVGKVELSPSSAGLAYFKGLFSAYESVADHKSISYRFSSNLIEEQAILLDKKRVAKIVNNLISNALKFTPEGGAVDLTVNLLPLIDRKEQEFLQLIVKDTGRGIPEEDIPLVFDRYFQTKRKDVPTEGGTGIGLAFSRELANLMDGSLRVESEWGKGSTFIFELPVSKADLSDTKVGDYDDSNLPSGESVISDTDELAIAAMQSPLAELKPKLLLVEDNPDMQRLITSILASSYDCLVANNGKEAWELLSEDPSNNQNISLIISDVMMPKMDGYSLLEHVKSHKYWRQMPMVMLTARAAEEDKLRALRLGVDDYLVKPFSSEEMLARVANLIQNYEQRQEFKALGIQIEFGSTMSAEQEWLKSLESNCLEAIDKKLSLSASYLSDLMAISERQLLRRIKSLTGLSTKQYIQEIKLQKAKHLLENKVFDTVSEVAYACDFNAPGYFTKVFQKHFGRKPSDYLD